MQKSKQEKTKLGRSSISRAATYDEMADFWGSHDITNYPTRPVKMDIGIKARRHYLAIDPRLMRKLTQEAMARGISSESLANLILQESLR